MEEVVCLVFILVKCRQVKSTFFNHPSQGNSNLTDMRLINLKTCKRNAKTCTFKKIINKLCWTKIHNTNIKFYINCKQVTPAHTHTHWCWSLMFFAVELLSLHSAKACGSGLTTSDHSDRSNVGHSFIPTPVL